MTSRRRRTRFGVLVSTSLLALAALSLPGPAPAIKLMPGERVLTEAQQAKALAAVSPKERKRLEKLFNDPTIMPVAYTAVNYEVVSVDGTNITVRPVGGYDTTAEESALVLPNMRTATHTNSSGSGGRYELSIYLFVGRTSHTSLEWVVAPSFQWTDWVHMNACNGAEDSWAISWAGNLTLNRDSFQTYWKINGSRFPTVYRSDMSPNVGVGWSFDEWMPWATSCDWTYYGVASAYIRETSWQNRTDNVAMKYFHTTGSGSYGLSFGPATITISPTSSQWSAAAYAYIVH